VIGGGGRTQDHPHCNAALSKISPAWIFLVKYGQSITDLL